MQISDGVTQHRHCCKGLWYWAGPTAFPLESSCCGHHGAAAVLWCGPKELVDAKACLRRGSGARTVGMGGAQQPFHPTLWHLLWDPREPLRECWNCDNRPPETDRWAGLVVIAVAVRGVRLSLRHLERLRGQVLGLLSPSALLQSLFPVLWLAAGLDGWREEGKLLSFASPSLGCFDGVSSISEC